MVTSPLWKRRPSSRAILDRLFRELTHKGITVTLCQCFDSGFVAFRVRDDATTAELCCACGGRVPPRRVGAGVRTIQRARPDEAPLPRNDARDQHRSSPADGSGRPAPTSGQQRYEYGASFTDHSSGLRFVGYRPQGEPDLWDAYLQGAWTRYRHHGVEAALNREANRNGGPTSLFWVAFDGDDIVAGLRCCGPLQSSTEASVLSEFATHPKVSRLGDLIDQRLAFGVMEIKAVWVALGRADHRALSEALSRCYVHAMDWFGARFAVCSASTHALDRWRSSGGRPLEWLTPHPYPDERYRSVVLWWDRAQLAELADVGQRKVLASETAQLWLSSGTLATDHALDARAPRLQSRGSRTRVADGLWKPQVLDQGDPNQSRVVRALLADASLEISDHYADQLRELDEVVPDVAPELMAESPRWVHYPWRSSMVRILGPRAFRRLRLDRNRNKITTDEQDTLGRLRIGVVGLSVGHAIAHTLALEGLCGELRLADLDTIELSNLNRIPATVFDLGLNKAVLAARRIAELDPYLAVTIVPDGLSAGNVDSFLEGLDVVIEECDSLDIKLLVREAARRHGIPVIMETSDRGMLDVERFDLEPQRPLLHGLVDDLHADEIAGLTTHDKVPYVLRILEPTELSDRMAASMAEIDQTVTTWPQLAGDVTLGAATVAAAVRRIGRGEPLASGRLRIDVQSLLGELTDPVPPEAIADPAPHTPLTRAVGLIDAVAQAANLAPSGGNTQPWRFEADEQQFRIYLRPERTSAMDVQFRGSYVAIGAALFNARCAASAHARLGPVEFFPRGMDDELVVTMHFGEGVDIDLAELYPALLTRSTNRRPGTPGVVDAGTLTLLREEAQREGARLHVVEGRPAIEQCADLLAESDRLRYLSPHLHDEMMSELRWPGERLETGIDVRTLELDRTELSKLAVARRPDIMRHLASWNAGNALGEVTHDRVRSSSALAVVTTEGKGTENYLRGGAAVERIWLTAERAGLAIQPVSPVFIFADERADYASLVALPLVDHLEDIAREFRHLSGLPPRETIALVLRVSHAPAPTARSMRLPTDLVLTRRAIDANPTGFATVGRE
jgi:molybdopterin/thiamine biosynthesis adenylyltransferase/nitroreductase